MKKVKIFYNDTDTAINLWIEEQSANPRFELDDIKMSSGVAPEEVIVSVMIVYRITA